MLYKYVVRKRWFKLFILDSTNSLSGNSERFVRAFETLEFKVLMVVQTIYSRQYQLVEW